MHAWPNRRGDVIRYLNQVKPDILCLQEAYVYMANEIKGGLGVEWRGYAVGRDDGRDSGECSGILFHSHRWSQLDQGTFWLSETPEQPGSRSWGTKCTRLCSWLRLRHNLSGKVLTVFNTHLDHISSEAREKGLRLILRQIAAISSDGTPYVLTGDFNMVPTESIMPNLLKKPAVQQTRLELVGLPLVWAPLHSADLLLASTAANHPPTFTGFLNEASYLIDYVLVHVGIRVVGYECLSNRPPHYSSVLSDHVPVSAHLTF